MANTQPPAKSAAPNPAEGLETIKPDPVAAKMVDDGVASPTGGTTQLEPAPEDYPQSARMTPVIEQVNPAAATAVGNLVNEGSDSRAAIEDGQKAQQKALDKGIEAGQRIAEAKRELADAQRDA